jgi:hypothetical protein
MPRPAHYKPKPLSREQQRFILWLVHQPHYSKKVATQTTFARELGVHPVTLSKWKQLPTFKAELSQHEKLQRQARSAAIKEAEAVRELIEWRQYKGLDEGKYYRRPAPLRPAPRRKKRKRRYQVWPTNVPRTPPPSQIKERNPHACSTSFAKYQERVLKYALETGSMEEGIGREMIRRSRRIREYYRSIGRSGEESD